MKCSLYLTVNSKRCSYKLRKTAIVFWWILLRKSMWFIKWLKINSKLTESVLKIHQNIWISQICENNNNYLNFQVFGKEIYQEKLFSEEKTNWNWNVNIKSLNKRCKVPINNDNNNQIDISLDVLLNHGRIWNKPLRKLHLAIRNINKRKWFLTFWNWFRECADHEHWYAEKRFLTLSTGGLMNF